ncbi:MAG: sporulation protein YqfD [Oscillospiraceae bacterium]
MRRRWNFLRGQVLVHIESGCPERVVNLCAGAEVPFWDVQWLSPVELTLRTTRRGLAQVRRAAEQVGASATVRRSRGRPAVPAAAAAVCTAGGGAADGAAGGGGTSPSGNFRSAATRRCRTRPSYGHWRITASLSAPGAWTLTRRTCATMCCWSWRTWCGWR